MRLDRAGGRKCGTISQRDIDKARAPLPDAGAMAGKADGGGAEVQRLRDQIERQIGGMALWQDRRGEGAMDPAIAPGDGDGDEARFLLQQALLRKSALGLTISFPVPFQSTASITALPRAEKRFMMAMRIWISAVWRSGSRDMIRSPKSFRQFICASTRLRTW